MSKAVAVKNDGVVETVKVRVLPRRYLHWPRNLTLETGARVYQGGDVVNVPEKDAARLCGETYDDGTVPVAVRVPA